MIRRTDVLLRPDPSRVVARLFLPGQEVSAPGASRATAIVARCLQLTEQQATEALDQVLADHVGRHRDLTTRLEAHFDAVAHRVEGAGGLSQRRRLLIGAYFTQEYSIEAAALFNPSVVVHPDQLDDPQAPDGGPAPDGRRAPLRFVLSARAVGEGHVSSIVFRTGRLAAGRAADATVTMDPGSQCATPGTYRIGVLDRERLRQESIAAGADPESVAFALAAMPDRFALAALDDGLHRLHDQQLTRNHAEAAAALMRVTAESSYLVEFDPETPLAERTLLPGSPMESHGLEDARFVRFTRDDGSTTYLATYTAYDGNRICSRRLQTDDFKTFRATTFTGRGATNKGMALFPRKVAGRYLALSRWDRENNAVASSVDGHDWPDVRPLQSPVAPWELIQLGNCGSPIETPHGWLVLTHGVGPMRSYSISAILLDLDDPTTVIGRLTEPLLRPGPDERDGYVPNVVYSCGALAHDDVLLLPYGCSDTSVRIALLELSDLLAALLPPTLNRPAPHRPTPPRPAVLRPARPPGVHP